MAYQRWKVKIWEAGREEPLETEYLGDTTERELIEFYGLKNPDVVRYKLEPENR